MAKNAKKTSSIQERVAKVIRDSLSVECTSADIAKHRGVFGVYAFEVTVQMASGDRKRFGSCFSMTEVVRVGAVHVAGEQIRIGAAK